MSHKRKCNTCGDVFEWVNYEVDCSPCQSKIAQDIVDKAFPILEENCSRFVAADFGFGAYQCKRKGTHGYDGKKYCKQHLKIRMREDWVQL